MELDIKKVIYFKGSFQLREWFKKNHKTGRELWLGYYKKSSGNESVTYPESVDTALCFGWIDGIRKSVDHLSYVIRFTPRNPDSNWSAVNIRRVEELKKLGVMESEGLKLYELRREDKSEVYSFKQSKAVLDNKYKNILKKNKKAWNYFEDEAPSYKKTVTHWIISAKREETRLRRLDILINSSEKGERIPLMRRTK